MKLDSVVSLKAALNEELQRPAAITPHVFVRAGGPAARTASFAERIDAVHTRRPESASVALGVAPGKNSRDFRLGARVQVAGSAGRRLAEELVRRARGEADVRVVPDIRKRVRTPGWFRRRRRPLEAGVSCGHFQITAGTLGFVAEDQHAYYALSNNHVLANVNAGAPGDPVVQPGPDDHRAAQPVSPKTLIGVLDRYVPISFQRANVVDCAVAALLPDLQFYVGWTEAIPGVVRGVKPVSVADLGRPVSKAGRTTGVTRGTITQVNVDRLQVDLGDREEKIATFSDQIEVEGDDGRPFSDAGDSGSLIVDRDGYGRALLFAGGRDDQGRDLTFANLLSVVLQKLGVTLVL